MDKKTSANQGKIKQKSVNKRKGKGKNTQAEIVQWQNQGICIVDNLDQCRDLATKLRSYVKKGVT